MDKRPSFTERLIQLRSWQITALGVTAVAAGLVATAILAVLLYGAVGNDWWWAVAVFHVLGSGAAWILVPKPFIEAYQLKQWLEQINLNRVRSLVPEDGQ